MAWTAKVIRKEKETTHLDIVVEFTDGTKVLVERFRFTADVTLARLKRMLISKISEIERREIAGADVVVGDVDLTVVPPGPPPPPTPEQLAKLAELAWHNKLRKLRIAEELVKLSVVPNNHPGLLTLRSDVVNDFLPSYFANIAPE